MLLTYQCYTSKLRPLVLLVIDNFVLSSSNSVCRKYANVFILVLTFANRSLIFYIVDISFFCLMCLYNTGLVSFENCISILYYPIIPVCA